MARSNEVQRLEDENAALRAQLAPRCLGNREHAAPCAACGYCEACHITVYGRYPNGESAAPHPFAR